MPFRSASAAASRCAPISAASGSASEAITVAPVRRASASRSDGTSPSAHTTVFSSLTLIGPCRYSIAGYDSAQVREASRSFSAASSATAAAQPHPRNVNSARSANSGGNGRATSRSAAAGRDRTSVPG